MIDLNNITEYGKFLNRPECVLATSNGRIYTADWRGGIAIIEPDKSQWYLLSEDQDFSIKPNGICLLEDGSFLVAHLGAEDGGVYKIKADGQIEPFCLKADGEVLPPTNYVHLDSKARVWITVSTRQIPRNSAYNQEIADGFIVLVDNGVARIVADNLGYTNECIVHPNGDQLYVNETFARKLVSFDILNNGDLTNKKTIATFAEGTYPDGLTFDTQGGVWVTSIVSNRVIRIDASGNQEIIVEDTDLGHLKWVEEAFQNGTMGRPHLDFVKSKKLNNISSLAFGGADLHLAYLGCLLGESIYQFDTSFNGHPPTHWNFPGPKRTTQELQS